MQLCLNTSMWRDRSLEEALAAARELGATAVELDVSPGSAHFDPLGGREAISHLKAHLGGLSVAALAADNADLTRLEDEGGDEAVTHLVASIKRAADLGARVVCLSLGGTDVDAWDSAWTRALEAIRMALFQTNRSSVRLSVTITGDDVLNSIRKARKLLGSIADARVGLTLDSAYLHYLRIPPPEALLAAGDRLYHVRLRDATRTDPHRSIGQGDVNFAALFRQLKQHDYQGALSLSLREAPEPAAVELLRGLLAQALAPPAAVSEPADEAAAEPERPVSNMAGLLATESEADPEPESASPPLS